MYIYIYIYTHNIYIYRERERERDLVIGCTRTSQHRVGRKDWTLHLAPKYLET